MLSSSLRVGLRGSIGNRVAGQSYDAIPAKLGQRITLWLDYTDSSTITTKKGVCTTHVASAANTSSNGCTHLNTPSDAIYDYRASGTGVPSPTTPAFTVILGYIPHGTIFNDTATVNEHIMCSRRNNMASTAVGWCLYAHKSGTDWLLGCYFDGFKFRSNNSISTTGVDGVSQVALVWDPSKTAGERCNIYINGVKCAKTTISGSEPSAASTTAFDTLSGPMIGWWYGHGSGYTTIVKAAMQVKQFGYWQRALSDAELLSFYNSGLTLSDSAVTTTYSPIRYWSFDSVADGIATGAANQHADIVAGAIMTPRQGTTAGVWLGTEQPAKTIWTCERITNKAATGGYIGLQGGNAIEYRQTGLTVDAPDYGSRSLRLNNARGQRRARLIGPSLVDVLDYTDGLVMYCVRQDTYHASEDFDLGVVTREDGVTDPGTPNSYMLVGHGVYLSTLRSPMVRTENAAITVGGAYIPTSIASPSTSTPYLISVLKIGGNYWFRRTDLTTGTALEQTTLTGSNTTAGFWWPSTLTSQGKSYEIFNMYGHVYVANNPKQYFGQCFVARDVSYAEMLALENYVKLNL